MFTHSHKHYRAFYYAVYSTCTISFTFSSSFPHNWGQCGVECVAKGHTTWTCWGSNCYASSRMATTSWSTDADVLKLFGFFVVAGTFPESWFWLFFCSAGQFFPDLFSWKWTIRACHRCWNNNPEQILKHDSVGMLKTDLKQTAFCGEAR